MKNKHLTQWNEKFSKISNEDAIADIFYEFIASARKRFANRFRFEGDENFTLAKQILFFETMFNYGSAGITNIYSNSKIKKEVINSLEQAGINSLNYDEIIKNKNGLLVITPSTYWFDLDNNIAKAIGIPAVQGPSQKFALDLSNKDTAFAKFSSEYECGWTRWGVFAALFSEAFVILRNKMTVANAKIVYNRKNNLQDNQVSKELLDINNILINLAPNQQSMVDGASPNKINPADLVGGGNNAVSRLDLGMSTITDIISGLEAIKSNAFQIYGERHNVQFKKERNITDDHKNDEIFLTLLEKSMENQLEIFITRYKEVFGIELTLIDLIKDEKEKMQEENQVNMVKKEESDKEGE